MFENRNCSGLKKLLDNNILIFIEQAKINYDNNHYKNKSLKIQKNNNILMEYSSLMEICFNTLKSNQFQKNTFT